MNTRVSGISLAAALLGSATIISSASAFPVQIGYQENGGGIVNVNGAPGFTTLGAGTSLETTGGTTPSGDFAISVNGTSSPNPLDTAQTTSVTSLSAGTDTLNVYVTATNITGPVGSVVFSSFLQFLNIPIGWTLTESTYISNTDALFGGSILSSQTVSGPVPPIVQATLTSAPTFANAPYSVTDEFTIVANSSDTTNGEISLSGHNSAQGVPGPLAGAGIPGLAFVLGGLLLWRHRRRHQENNNSTGQLFAAV